jgi:hypothetical protein
MFHSGWYLVQSNLAISPELDVTFQKHFLMLVRIVLLKLNVHDDKTIFRTNY